MRLLATLMLLSFSTLTMAIDGLNLGVSLLGSKSDKVDDFDVNGVLIIDYAGYNFDLRDDLALQLVPTSAEIGLSDGSKTQVYTDLATLQYYGEDNFIAMVNAIAIDYKDYDNFAIQEKKKMALVEAVVTKFIPVGKIEFDLSGIISAGGEVETKDLINDGTTKLDTDHKYTAEVMGGVFIPLKDSLDLYVYAGTYREEAKAYVQKGSYFGAELPFQYNNLTTSIYLEVENTDKNYVLGSSQGDSLDDQMIKLGIKVNF